MLLLTLSSLLFPHFSYVHQVTSSCLDALTYFLADAAAIGNNTLPLPPLPPVPVTSLLPGGAGGGGIASAVPPLPLIITATGHTMPSIHIPGATTGVEPPPSSLLQSANSQTLPAGLIPAVLPPSQLPLPLPVEVGVEVGVGGPVVTMLSQAMVVDTLKLVLSSLGRCKARLAAVRVIASLTEWPQVIFDDFDVFCVYFSTFLPSLFFSSLSYFIPFITPPFYHFLPPGAGQVGGS